MAVTLINTNNAEDVAFGVFSELAGPSSLTTFVFDGKTFLCIGAADDNAITLCEVSAGGLLLGTEFVDDGDATDLNLTTVTAVTTVFRDGQPFVYASGFLDDGISGFAALANGQLVNIDNIDDAGALELEGAAALVAGFSVTGTTDFLFAAGNSDSGISSFEVADDGTLINRDNVDDGEAAGLELLQASALAFTQIGPIALLIAAGFDDDGISTFSVDGDGNMSNIDNVTDAGALELDGVRSLDTAKVGAKTFLFAAGQVDDGVSVFEILANGELDNVFNLSDDATINLDGASAVTTAEIAGTIYLFVAAGGEAVSDGVSVFAVAADGSLVHMANVNDADNAELELDGAIAVSVATVGGRTFLVAAGEADDGVSVFIIFTTGLTINGSRGDDIIDALNSVPGELLPSELGDVINGLGGDDRLEGLVGDDVLTGGAGRDIQLGGAGNDRFDFNAASETKSGSLGDKIMHFQRGQDHIDLRDMTPRRGSPATTSSNSSARTISTT